MPHAHYFAPFLLCPWMGCGFRIELVDFRVETLGNPALYRRVVAAWGWVAGYGLLARCPGCSQQVLFTPAGKQAAGESAGLVCDVLPDDWHLNGDFP